MERDFVRFEDFEVFLPKKKFTKRETAIHAHGNSNMQIVGRPYLFNDVHFQIYLNLSVPGTSFQSMDKVYSFSCIRH
jgi:hypothetical protein